MEQNIIEALKVWEKLGDIPVTEDGERLDEDFEFTKNGEVYKYDIGSSVIDLWHDLEEIFYPFSVGYAANGLYKRNE